METSKTNEIITIDNIKELHLYASEIANFCKKLQIQKETIIQIQGEQKCSKIAPWYRKKGVPIAVHISEHFWVIMFNFSLGNEILDNEIHCASNNILYKYNLDITKKKLLEYINSAKNFLNYATNKLINKEK